MPTNPPSKQPLSGNAKQPLSGKQKQAIRQRAKRERLIRQRPPGFKEKFLSGCLVFGILGAIVFIAAFTWACIFRR